MDDEGGYATPEEAALSGWVPVANARVLEVRYEDETAFVLVDTEPLPDQRLLRAMF